MERGLILKKETIVDSTFIESPYSTKNREKKRDSEAHSSRKGNTWHFGYKAHIGVDEKNGLVHTVKVTAANEHDVTVMSELLHGEEERAYGDSGYAGAQKRPEAIKKNKAEKNQVNHQQMPIFNQEIIPKRSICRQEKRTSKIICSLQSRTCFCSCEELFPVSQNTTPKSAKTDGKTEYHVRTGESLSG